VIRAPIPNANGTAISVYPEYSIGGWNIMLGCWSSGSSPAPFTGATRTVSNGLAANAASARKKPPRPSSTAVAYGAISRRRRRVRNRTALDQNDDSITQSSSDPCWEDHGAVSL